MVMELILFGATGCVGVAVLERMISMQAIDKVYVISRSEVPQANRSPKVEVIRVQRFDDFSEDVLHRVRGAQGCVWAINPKLPTDDTELGDFRVASCDWPVTTARLLSARHRGNFNFVFISDRFAGGPPSRASLYEKSRAWTKGAAEENLFEASLAESENLSPFFIRPASIDPRYHREIHQWLPDIGTKPKWKSPEKSLRWKRMSDLAIDTYKVTPTRELAAIIVYLATSPHGRGRRKKLGVPQSRKELRTFYAKHIQKIGGKTIYFEQQSFFLRRAPQRMEWYEIEGEED